MELGVNIGDWLMVGDGTSVHGLGPKHKIWAISDKMVCISKWTSQMGGCNCYINAAESIYKVDSDSFSPGYGIGYQLRLPVPVMEVVLAEL